MPDELLPVPSPDRSPAEPCDAQGERPAAAALEPLLVGRQELAKLLAISVATLDRWEQTGKLGPVGRTLGPAGKYTRGRGRKLWVLAEVRLWVTLGMVDRRAWRTMRQAAAGRACCSPPDGELRELAAGTP